MLTSSKGLSKLKTEAELARDEAIGRVRTRLTEEEMVDAVVLVGSVAERVPDFTTDDIPFRFPKDVDGRVIGAVMTRAAREGFCDPTDRTRKSKQVQCHARPKQVWLSTLYTEES